MNAHLLDRPAWAALTTRQADMAVGDARAWRMSPEYGPFGSAADASPESLAALAALAEAGPIVVMEAGGPPPVPPGLVVVKQAAAVQMVAAALTPGDTPFAYDRLTDADGEEMRALTLLTEPGPFHRRTHRLGAFVGVRVEGRLVAMAGERMRPPGFTEVSGVCTHPDHRGRGYAAGLMRVIASDILARGETPFLQAYAHNTSAISVYERLGFRHRRDMTTSYLARA